LEWGEGTATDKFLHKFSKAEKRVPSLKSYESKPENKPAKIRREKKKPGWDQTSKEFRA